MHNVEVFELVLALLGLVVALYLLAQKLLWPPSSALLIGGSCVAFIPGLPSMTLDPELALVLFLPPLLLDGAYSTPLGRFRQNLPGILSLAVGTVIVTTLAVGVVTHWLMPSLPWAACFTLGAIVSPPDAVSARAVLKSVVLPRRLTALLEGESLLNDATGLILFRFAVAATLSGTFSMSDAIGSFLFVAVGGAIVGYAIAHVWIWILKRIDDLTVVVIANALLGWAAYLAGEALHVSGVIATVAAGLVLSWHQHTLFAAQVRLVGGSFWRVLVFALEAMVFILIGFSLRGVIDRTGGIEALPAIWLWVMAAVVITVSLTRVASIAATDLALTVANRAGLKRFRPLGFAQAAVLSWAGMRGVVTLAVPLTLPIDFPGRDLIILCAFAVIFATVIVQGSSLGWLIRLVNPIDSDPPARYAMPAAELAIARARFAAIEGLAYAEDGTLIHPQLLEFHRRRLSFMERYEADATTEMGKLQTHFDAAVIGIQSGREELLRLHRDGDIEDDVMRELERDLDVEELVIISQRGE